MFNYVENNLCIEYFSENGFLFIFCSISHFAKMYATKLGAREDVLKRTLWGDFYLNSKTKQILKGAQVSFEMCIRVLNFNILCFENNHKINNF